jgi:hypothetical protein
MFEVIEDSIRVGCGVLTVVGVALFFILLATTSAAVLLLSNEHDCTLLAPAFAVAYTLVDLFSFGYKKLKKLF